MSERNYEIDLLRIFATFMVIVLHVLLHGGILEAAPFLSMNHEIAWFLEIAFLCAVNCYGLISGYVGINNSFKLKNIINLWFVTFFYQITVAIIFYLFIPESLSSFDIIKYLFPVIFPKYWYFIAYLGAFFFFPFWNHLLNSLSKIQATQLTTLIILLLSFLPTFCRNDLFCTKEGYSFLWLSALYILGAYIKKYFPAKIASYKLLLFYFSCIAFTYASKLFIQLFGKFILGTKQDGAVFIAYTSPTILFAAISLLLLFSQLDITGNKHILISFFAPLSYGIYLLHIHPLIRNHFLLGSYAHYVKHNSLNFIIKILTTALIIYFICSLIESLRIKIFHLLRIHYISSYIDKFISIHIKKLIE